VGQCVCVEHDDKSWNACVGKNLKRVGKRGRFSQLSIYSTTPFADLISLSFLTQSAMNTLTQADGALSMQI
jgi:hypothetical protein